MGRLRGRGIKGPRPHPEGHLGRTGGGNVQAGQLAVQRCLGWRRRARGRNRSPLQRLRAHTAAPAAVVGGGGCLLRSKATMCPGPGRQQQSLQ